MRLIKFRHKGLRQLYTEDNPKGVSASHLDKVEKLLGDMKGYWSLTVTGNWRIVFRYDETTNTVSDIDLIDYH
jgi:proteic killer suppression protein